MILLTGASGYIGSAIYASLKRQSISVVTAGRSDCDRFLDLSQDGISPELFSNVTVVIHCAGIAHNKGGSSAYRVVNVEACQAFASAAVAAGVDQFIFLSSLNVVPASTVDPGASADVLPKPESLYAESKWRAEISLSKLIGPSPCELIILRPALVYDVALAANLAMLQKWQSRLPVSLPATGRRSLVARPDLVELIVSLACGTRKKPARSGQPLAVTDGQCYSALRIGEALANKTPMKLPAPLWRMVLAGLAGLPFQRTQALAASLGGSYWCGETAQPFNNAVWSLERLLGAPAAESVA